MYELIVVISRLKLQKIMGKYVYLQPILQFIIDLGCSHLAALSIHCVVSDSFVHFVYGNIPHRVSKLIFRQNQP